MTPARAKIVSLQFFIVSLMVGAMIIMAYSYYRAKAFEARSLHAAEKRNARQVIPDRGQSGDAGAIGPAG